MACPSRGAPANGPPPRTSRQTSKTPRHVGESVQTGHARGNSIYTDVRDKRILKIEVEIRARVAWGWDESDKVCSICEYTRSHEHV